MEWVSVKDKVPKESTPKGDWLIAYSWEYGIFPARFVKNSVSYFENLLDLDRDGDPEYVWYDTDSKWNVTHWTLRPDTPKPVSGQE